MLECHLVDETVAYALHQMNAREREAFQAHLSECAACRLKLAELIETIDLLPLATPLVTPPPGLRSLVLDRIAAESGVSDARRRRYVPVWAAVAAAFALVVGMYALMQVDRLRHTVDGFTRAAPVEQTVMMAGTYAVPNASGRMLVSREGGGTRITLQVQGLPPLEGPQAYQLWLIKDGVRTNGGVFVVDAAGKGGLATWLPGHVAFDSCGITKEPDALGAHPRGTKVMGSDLW